MPVRVQPEAGPPRHSVDQADSYEPTSPGPDVPFRPKPCPIPSMMSAYRETYCARLWAVDPLPRIKLAATRGGLPVQPVGIGLWRLLGRGGDGDVDESGLSRIESGSQGLGQLIGRLAVIALAPESFHDLFVPGTRLKNVDGRRPVSGQVRDPADDPAVGENDP